MISTVDRSTANNTLLSSTPEADLILYCARSQLNPKIKSQIAQLLNLELDWQTITKLATKHKLLPLLSYHLNSYFPEQLITSNLHIIRDNWQQTTRTNLKLVAELLKIVSILEKQKIDVLSLKGPILAYTSYNNFGLRKSIDLDLIVRQQDFSQAQEILTKNGYQTHGEKQIERKQQLTLYRKGSDFSIDLHYNFAPQKYFISVDSDIFWHNLQSISLGNQHIKYLSPENLLLYLCLEGSKECWRKLNRICDVAESINNQKIDWQLVINHAKILNKEGVLYLGIFLAKELLDVAIPENIWQTTLDYLQPHLSANELKAFLFRSQFDLNLSWKWDGLNLKAFKSYAEKLNYLWRFVEVNYQVFRNKNKKLIS